MRPAGLTDRQAECLDWLTEVGKASDRLALTHGFAKRTLDAIVEAGLATREALHDPPGRIVGYVYRPKDHV